MQVYLPSVISALAQHQGQAREGGKLQHGPGLRGRVEVLYRQPAHHHAEGRAEHAADLMNSRRKKQKKDINESEEIQDAQATQVNACM
jgi:hypothetical protein